MNQAENISPDEIKEFFALNKLVRDEDGHVILNESYLPYLSILDVQRKGDYEQFNKDLRAMSVVDPEKVVDFTLTFYRGQVNKFAEATGLPYDDSSDLMLEYSIYSLKARALAQKEK